MEGFLSSKEVVEKYIEGAKTKIDMPFGRLFGKAVMAGMMIAMGAAISSVAAHTVTDVGLARLAAAVVFPVGLMMVMLLGAELFTGDCLVAMSVMDGKHKVKDLLRVLSIVYVGNFFGALATAIGIAMSGQLNYSAGMLGAYTIKVALGKVQLSVSQGIVSGILCNILVCAAILMAMTAKDITGRLVAIFFTIMLFVTGGFEHCVANMYYITAGMIAKLNPQYAMLAMETYGFTQQQLDVLNVVNFIFVNLVPVTIGNVIGGIVCFGMPMYYQNVQLVKNVKPKREETTEHVICTTISADALH